MKRIFEIFHIEMSGKYNKEKQYEKRKLILVTFEVSNLDISGKEINTLQFLNT